MPRGPRSEFSGAIYHVLLRGAVRQAIYRDEVDYERFLDLLGRVVGRQGWRCHAYCLMTTHYHLLVETPKPNLATGMHRLNGGYAQSFNRRYGSSGHVFERRYRALVVDRDAYLLEVARYIVLNPVRAGACAAPEEWPWSSFAATAGFARRRPFLTTRWTLGLFGAEPGRARERYRTFVREGRVPGPGPGTRPS